MKESKCGVLICSLCLLLAFSAPALGQQKQEQLKPGEIMSEAQIKARAAAAKREQLNQELFAAVNSQASGTVLKLLAAGADVNGRDRDGMTPLMHAALQGSSELTQLLLGKGAVVNLTDTFGITALMQAAWAGHTQVVEMLMTQGADLNLQSILEVPRLKKAGINALMGASMNGNLEVVRLLLASDARLNQQDAQGQTALMHASREGFSQIVDLLLSKGANTEIKDEFGRTALTVATIYAHYDVVCLLVTAGANVHTTDIHNMKPIVYASALDRGEIYKYLQAAMARRPLSTQAVGFRRAP
ncbi:MAG: ankyrin repeat domain-containing protein [Syntrophobacteraceae bacterium]|jgi:ankyrin repeat protein